MAGKRTLGVLASVCCLAGLLCYLAIVIFNCELSGTKAGQSLGSGDSEDQSYARIPHTIDRECRTERLGITSGSSSIESSALAGFSNEYIFALTDYTQLVLTELNATSLTRHKFYHLDRERIDYRFGRYPDDANPQYDRDVNIPLLILPRPESVQAWSASAEAQSLGWRTQAESIRRRGTVFGHTLIFNRGQLSVNPLAFPASPHDAIIPSWDLYVPDHDTNYFLVLGKVVLTPYYDTFRGEKLVDRSESLRLGEPLGATQLGELFTIPAFLGNTRLHWTSIQGRSGVRRFLAYSLVDGNGAQRTTEPGALWTSKLTSPYIRPLICKPHQPMINQHDALLMPTPLGWPPTIEASVESHSYDTAHEEWCLDDWFPAQKDACWVIREAEDSKPLQESFLLMPALEPSERPVFFVSVFAETEPTQLVRELAALHKVSPDKVLNSPETMARLQSLYERVRDFPLAD